MAKRRGSRRSSSGLPGGANPMAMLQKMQQDMAEAQESLERETTEVSVGGGAIKVVRVVDSVIAPDALDQNEEPAVDDPLIAAGKELGVVVDE